VVLRAVPPDEEDELFPVADCAWKIEWIRRKRSDARRGDRERLDFGRSKPADGDGDSGGRMADLLRTRRSAIVRERDDHSASRKEGQREEPRSEERRVGEE